ncbi:MAG: ribonuclease R [Gemmatimonadales bacterium]|nr:MAG: ribonuclease R [Gemmatimonadales bacterium]
MTHPDLPNAQAIRSALEGSRRGPLRAKELAHELGVPKARYRDFKAYLRKLEEVGEVYRIRSNRYSIPEKINLTVGTLRVIRSGDGFVRPEARGAEEVFVPAARQDSAMDGDRVAVRIEGRPRGQAPVGRILKIFERARPTVVGTFRQTRNFGFVAPLDRRVSRDVLVPQGMGGSARSGDIVVVRISQYGSSKQNSVGEVERVLGPMEAPGVDVLAILHGHGLPREFPTKVEDAAAASAEWMDRPGERTDCRDLLVFTIDPVEARDHDDALSVRELENGKFLEVGIHIADVAHFVREGSPLDLEARTRGTSVYLVDQVVPMLPHLLSSDLCSLRTGEDRLAFSLFLVLDAETRVREYRFEKTWIRCRYGLHYQQVQDVLEGRGTVNDVVDAALLKLDRLARRLRTLRRQRGSLDFDLPEARVVLDDEGTPQDIRKVTQLDSNRLIEEFMLLANETVARVGQDKRLPIPFRIHEPPPAPRLDELRSFLASVGHSLPRGRVDGRALQAVLERVEGRPEEALVSTVILRHMQKARYDAENLGHFGLASPAYTHFTSPIRRYPDLVTHRVLHQALLASGDVPERWGGEFLEEIAESSSERERRAQQAERDSVEMKKIEFMRRHLGEEFQGTIAGVTSFGFFVLLDRYYVEGLVHVSTLGDDFYRFIEEAYALVGERSRRRFRLGDRVRVQVVRADKEERQVDFKLLERLPAPAAN